MLLILVWLLLAAAARSSEPFEDTGSQRLIASAVREGVNGLAAFPDVLVVRQGKVVYGLDPFTLVKLWQFEGRAPAGDPLALGGRLFLVDKEVRKGEHGSSTTYDRIVELDPSTGRLRWQREAVEDKPPLLSACGTAAFAFGDGTVLTVRGADPPSRVSLAKHFGRDLTSSASFDRTWVTGSHLVTWSHTSRLVFAVPLEPQARPWYRTFDEDPVDVQGCGERLAFITSHGTVVGVEAQSGKTVWKVEHPGGDRSVFFFTPGISVPLPAGRRPVSLDAKDGSIQPLALEPVLAGARGLLQDEIGRSVLFVGNRLAVYDFASGAEQWTHDAGEPIRHLATTGGYLALATESGKIEVLAHSRLQAPAGERAAEAGALELTVDPDDAFVWLDGYFLGRGGRRIESLSPGAHPLRLVHPDRRRLDQKVEIAPGQISVVTLVMASRSQGPIRITSIPDGATVSIDGSSMGETPLPPRYGVAAGQVLEVILKKTGYRNLRLPLTVGEDGAEVSASLEFAPLAGGVFTVGGRTSSGPILGWRQADIGKGTVQGEPLRPAAGDSFLSGSVFVELGPRRWRLFGRGTFSNHRTHDDGEGGLWVALDRKLRVEFGASYLGLQQGPGNSEPPNRCGGGQRGCRQDRDAPLEEWDHPIPNVFVQNVDPSYWLARIRLRPKVGLFVEVGVGRLERARVRGTALVPDAAGHLVRDEARSYDFSARDGTILEARLQMALETFRVRKFFPGSAVEIRYRLQHTDFGAVDEASSELTFGVGLLGFWSKPGLP